MTSHYRRGADLERKAKKALEDNGAIYVVRAAGSHGPADLIAFYIGAIMHCPDGSQTVLPMPRVEFVQAKRSGKMSKTDQWALCELAQQCGATPVLAYQGPRGEPVKFRVLSVEKKVA